MLRVLDVPEGVSAPRQWLSALVWLSSEFVVCAILSTMLIVGVNWFA